MTRATLIADAAARMPLYERLETLILAAQQDGHTSGTLGGAIRLGDHILANPDRPLVGGGGAIYTARTTRTGWIVQGPDCIGAAPSLLDACQLATMGA